MLSDTHKAIFLKYISIHSNFVNGKLMLTHRTKFDSKQQLSITCIVAVWEIALVLNFLDYEPQASSQLTGTKTVCNQENWILENSDDFICLYVLFGIKSTVIKTVLN